MIPFLDVKASYLELQGEIDAAIAKFLQSGSYVLGNEVEAFEAEFAAFCNCQHAIGVGNGLDALSLALRAVGVKAGDEVIVPSNTFIATWLSVSHCGAIPVPVEPIDATFNLNAALIEAAITARTKAIVVVHLYGQPADIDPILSLAKRHGLRVVEDAAQAHGARYKGNRIGGHGDAVCWSFYPGKNLGAIGDGGAVTTNSADIAREIRIARNYGSSKKYVHESKGHNSRLDSLQAAILRVKLHHLEEWNMRRKEIAARYTAGLSGLGIILPIVPEWAEPAWHLYVVRHPHRDFFREELSRRGIGTLVHYPIPPHLQEAYKGESVQQAQLPIAERMAADVLSLPIGPQLASADLCEVIKNLGQIAAAAPAA